MEKPINRRSALEYDTRVARVCARLNAEGARYLLIGTSAMQLWGTTTATDAIEVLIEPTNANARNALRALATLNFGFATEQMVSDVASHPVTVIGSTPRVELFTRVHTLEWKDAQSRAVMFQVEGVPLPTVSISDLQASKRTGFPHDVSDLTRLEEIARRLSAGSTAT